MCLSQILNGFPPSIGTLKLNFDGRTRGNQGAAGVGGVFHNLEGSIRLSYSGPAGFCTIDEAELLALMIGLCEAKNLDVSHLSIKGESFCVIQWAVEKSKPPWYLFDVIEEVINIFKKKEKKKKREN